VEPPDLSPAFLSPLRTEKLAAQRWLLIDDLVYRSALLRGLFVAPRGFQTDFASIPRPLWAVFPKEDRYDQAAVIHDAAYGHALQTPGGDRIELVKVWADRLFYEAMRVNGVPMLQAWSMFRAVHVFGNPHAHPLAANRITTGQDVKVG
jgi:hypothetical protein